MKDIIICGAGEVGTHTAEILVRQGHHVSVIDTSIKRLQILEEIVDIKSVVGSACYGTSLKDAGVDHCDLLMAATDQDEVNLLTAVLARQMGANKVVSRIHDPNYMNSRVLDYKRSCFIDFFVCPEQLTANAIVEQLENPGVAAIERFAQNQIRMHRYVLNKESPVAGVKLSDLNLPRGVRLAVIKRQHHSFVPTHDTSLYPGDIVTLVGESECLKSVKKYFQKEQRNERNIAIMGASLTSEWIINRLLDFDFSIRLFESDINIATKFSEKFPGITVLNSNPVDSQEFKRERLIECSAFIAASNDGEDNVIGALQAKQMGAKLTFALVYNPTYLPLISNLGVDYPFTPRIDTSKELLRIVDDSQVKKLATLSTNVAEVYELVAEINGSGIDRDLSSLSLPNGAFIAAIQREGLVKLPGAKDRVLPGDTLVVIGPQESQKLLKKLFIKG